MFNKNNIDKSQVYKKGIGAGIAEIAYVILVVLLMTSMDKFMQDSAGSVLAILAILLLLVFSAAVSAVLVFGWPAYLALQKKHDQAILTLLVTLLTLFVGFILVLLFTFAS